MCSNCFLFFHATATDTWSARDPKKTSGPLVYGMCSTSVYYEPWDALVVVLGDARSDSLVCKLNMLSCVHQFVNDHYGAGTNDATRTCAFLRFFYVWGLLLIPPSTTTAPQRKRTGNGTYVYFIGVDTWEARSNAPAALPFARYPYDSVAAARMCILITFLQ